MGKRDASHFITEYYTEGGKVELMIPTDATYDDFALLKDMLALIEAKLKRRTDRKTEPRKEQNFCGKCRYLYRDFKYGLSCYRLMDNEPCKYEERKTEPTTEDCSTVPTSSKMEQVEDDPQTEMPRCSVNGTPFDECGFCEYFNCDTCKCEADVPQTERSRE